MKKYAFLRFYLAACVQTMLGHMHGFVGLITNCIQNIKELWWDTSDEAALFSLRRPYALMHLLKTRVCVMSG